MKKIFFYLLNFGKKIYGAYSYNFVSKKVKIEGEVLGLIRDMESTPYVYSDDSPGPHFAVLTKYIEQPVYFFVIKYKEDGSVHTIRTSFHFYLKLKEKMEKERNPVVSVIGKKMDWEEDPSYM